jgi:signal transduction histidine kinase
VKFLDDLRAYLERPEALRFMPDTVAHRRHLLAAFEALEKQGGDRGAIAREHKRWDDARLQDFTEGMAYLLAGSVGYAASSVELARLIDVALDRELGLSASSGSYTGDLEIDRLREERNLGGQLEVARYAVRLRAMRPAAEGPLVTPLGKLILELHDRDAVRWLLAAEAVQAHGPSDEWHISVDVARLILENPECSWDLAYAEPPLHEWRRMRRLSELGLVSVEGVPGTSIEEYTLLPEGRPLLQEIASGKDTPFMLLARALLQDETASVLNQYPAAAAHVRQESAAAIATRHSRLVAHEIRNALLPIRATLSDLYDEIERRGQAEILAKRRDRIDAGISRLFGFVRDVAQTASLGAEPMEPFNFAPAIETAMGVIGVERARAIPFVQQAELPPVRGHRDRFILALVNVLRNAVQAREDPPVEIRVTAGVNNGAEVFVRVDDDGPGVAPEDRKHLFSSGFSRRAGGSGEGLAFVREVVEGEMAGSVVYEESLMGGASFVVRLPVGTRRST